MDAGRHLPSLGVDLGKEDFMLAYICSIWMAYCAPEYLFNFPKYFFNFRTCMQRRLGTNALEDKKKCRQTQLPPLP